MKATAVANTNIAMVKYWGKRDEKLILPYNGSISMTCKGLFTTTTVEFSKKYKKDIFIINGKKLENDEKQVSSHLERIRKLAKIRERAKVVSRTNFPIKAGLGSSASGLASFTLAASRAAGLVLSRKELSILTRQGSGSASRSVFGGFVEWKKGKRRDGRDSFAKQIVNENYWPDFRVIFVILSNEKKKVGSRGGMALTVKTSPFYKCWLKTIDKDLRLARKGILKKDFSLLGSLAEHNCLKMHSLMVTTKPALIYWLPETVEVIRSVMEWREEGLESYFTIDAGPNVVIMCMKKDEKEIRKRLSRIKVKKEIVTSQPGAGVEIIEENLF